MPAKKIRVLVIDDSALVRQILTQGLNMDSGIEVIDTAADPFQARDKIVATKPDVLTLDVEMPRMDGVEFLQKLMPQYPIPVVMVSALTQKGKQITLEALNAGAVDFVTKPSANITEGLSQMMVELRTKIKIASTANVSNWKYKRNLPTKRAPNRALEETTDKVIAIGASTGGTEAIREVLAGLPANAPGIVIVQHMPPGFTKMFSERLNQHCSLIVKEAEHGDRILPGRALVAPGDKHLTVVRRGSIYEVACRKGDPVGGHCPSVDVLMHSVAKEVGNNAIGIMLTGMGRDGAEGMLAMRQAGASTLAQDEATCVVFGMPREAFLNGGAERLVPLHQMASSAIRLLRS